LRRGNRQEVLRGRRSPYGEETSHKDREERREGTGSLKTMKTKAGKRGDPACPGKGERSQLTM